MIEHPGARTRALYRWETEELEVLGRRQRTNQTRLRKFTEKLWEGERWNKWRKPPIICVAPLGELSHSLGYAYVFLNPEDAHFVCVAHELAHARGYGAGADMHNVEFVRMYLYLLAKYGKLDYMRLHGEAVVRGLL